MNLRRLVSALGWAGLLAAILASPAVADPTRGLTSSGTAPSYNVTDLGTSYSFTKTADGSTTSVTGGNGQTFAFDKYPVMPVDSSRLYNGGGSNGSSWWDPIAKTCTDMFVTAGNRFGSIGYGEVYHSYPDQDYWARAAFRDPSGVERDLNWQTIDPSIQPPPSVAGYAHPATPIPPESPNSLARDFNTSGQVVGSDQHRAVENGANPLGSGNRVPDDLNYDIAAELASRLTLTGALSIDDLGRIVAEDASTGDDYLLTPTYLPSPAPEPSTLAIIGIALAGLGARAGHRRLKAAMIR